MENRAGIVLWEIMPIFKVYEYMGTLYLPSSIIRSVPTSSQNFLHNKLQQYSHDNDKISKSSNRNTQRQLNKKLQQLDFLTTENI